MPLLLGVVIWFGANYFFLTGFIAERVVLKECSADNRAWCRCVADHMLGGARLDLALWSSSFGMLDGDGPNVVTARRKGLEQCPR